MRIHDLFRGSLGLSLPPPGFTLVLKDSLAFLRMIVLLPPVILSEVEGSYAACCTPSIFITW